MSDCSTSAFKVPEKPELLPCPHCGEKAFGDTFRVEGDRWLFSVKCDKCQAVTWSESKDLSVAQKEATEAWNTRYEPTCHNTNDKYSRNWNCSLCCHSFVVSAADEKPFDYCPGCGVRVEKVD